MRSRKFCAHGDRGKRKRESGIEGEREERKF